MEQPRVSVAKKLDSVRGRQARLKEAGEQMASGLRKAAASGKRPKAASDAAHSGKKSAA